jgi:hypothetical protein
VAQPACLQAPGVVDPTYNRSITLGTLIAMRNRKGIEQVYVATY